MWWTFVIGYAFSTIVGHVLIKRVMRPIVYSLGYGVGLDARPLPELPALLGILERCLFTASWQFGKAEFIGLWLALKVAGQYKHWVEGNVVQGRHIPGRLHQDAFLIGCALSVGYGVTGGLIIEWLNKGLFLAALTVPWIVLAATIAIWRFVTARFKC